jgi:hypothetical protein
MNTSCPPQYLTLEEVVARVCAGEPIHWVTVRYEESGGIVEMALAAIDHRGASKRGGAS